ncbi:hypothetical protein NBH00_14715 [Paraconexibacter antarcticus]|uniref:Acyltransferase n=1 Tax=Paraconexibacter antarcticus TaxID=2949664 RepID=A0ABY5DPE6_9ACTN|nr:hypothetical protein [Paraconexibacter antarcticus]UTI62610.1 hypothetical protein NBH00_14715 [Paraconexibacter antarcticus]
MRYARAVLMILLPAAWRPAFARRLLGWDVHPTAYIGRSIIVAQRVTLGPGAIIGPWNLIRDLEELRLGAGAQIASRNRIAGLPPGTSVFRHSPNRDPSLVLDDHAEITVGHEIDCCDRVHLHRHAVIAGVRSQVLTHSLNLVRDRQETGPVVIGEHSAIMTGCIIASGTCVPARCIVSAGSVVNTKLTRELTFYRGNPAEPVRELPARLQFFRRGENTASSVGATGPGA